MLQKIVLKPGISREQTSYASEGGWYDCDKVRFNQGFPEKLGGWLRRSASTFQGVCRSLWQWTTLGSQRLVGVGTNLKFYLERGGMFYDITPIRTKNTTTTLSGPFAASAGSATITVTMAAHGAQIGDVVVFTGATGLGGNITAALLNMRHVIVTVPTANTFTITASANATAGDTGNGGAVGTTLYVYASTLGSNPFSMTSGSATVTVSHTAHGALLNDFVTFSGATAAGGLTISGEYQIASVTSANAYTITAASTASSTTTGGGTAVLASYQINTGASVPAPSVGWGAGTWGSGTWGSGGTTTSEIRIWSQYNFGEDLVFGPKDGAIYYWDATGGTSTRGVALETMLDATSIPSVQSQLMVSERFVIAFGANDLTSATQDPMLIRWASLEDATQWYPSVTNTAGSLPLSRGSRFVGALQMRQEILVWTDAALYAMQFIGAPDVWGASLAGENVSCMSGRAMASASGIAFWMGVDKFYRYDGRVATLPCTVQSYVFGDIDITQADQVFAGTNEGFDEVWWFYCSSGATTVDRYVIFNYEENTWYYGTLGRSAWLDSGVSQNPIAATYSYNLVDHESGVDDGTAGENALVAMDAYVTSADFALGDGHTFSFVSKLLPDVQFSKSTAASPVVTFTLQPLNASGSGRTSPASVGGNSNGTSTRTATVPIEEYTDQVSIRVRGRQMTLKVSSNSLGTQWRLGVPRIDIRPDGRRA